MLHVSYLEDERFDLVGINDLCSFEQMAYLLQYDSVYPRLSKCIELQKNSLMVEGEAMVLFSEPKPENMDIKALNIDVVLQCTGMFLDRQSNMPLLENGAKRGDRFCPCNRQYADLYLRQ